MKTQRIYVNDLISKLELLPSPSNHPLDELQVNFDVVNEDGSIHPTDKAIFIFVKDALTDTWLLRMQGGHQYGLSQK